MLVRLIISGSVRIMRATDQQAQKLGRMARKHGLSFQAWADWESNAALASQASGYDAEVTRDECDMPEDEKRAAESGYRPTVVISI